MLIWRKQTYVRMMKGACAMEELRIALWSALHNITDKKILEIILLLVLNENEKNEGDG